MDPIDIPIQPKPKSFPIVFFPEIFLYKQE